MLPSPSSLVLESFPELSAPEVKQLFEIFQGKELRFVGGCIRNALIHEPIWDVDFATPLLPEEVMDLLKSQGVNGVPTGIEHGTVTAVIHKKTYQITTLRQDAESDGRRSRVVFGQDWQQDAQRRDFTFNSLYMDQSGQIFDPFEGIKDLKSGVVRFIGEPRQRIEEDYLRILRYFRFLAYFGKGPIDQEALKACIALAPQMKKLSSERIRDEFLKLLQAQNPLPSLELIKKHKILSDIDFWNFEALAALISVEEKGRLPRSPWRRLFLLCHPTNWEALGEQLKLSRKQITLLNQLDKRYPFYTEYPCRDQECLYADGADLFWDLSVLQTTYFVTVDDKTGNTVPEILEEKRQLLGAWEKPVFPITGEDLKAFNLPPSKHYKLILEACEAWWVAREFTPRREACLEWIQDKLDYVQEQYDDLLREAFNFSRGKPCSFERRKRER